MPSGIKICHNFCSQYWGFQKLLLNFSHCYIIIKTNSLCLITLLLKFSFLGSNFWLRVLSKWRLWPREEIESSKSFILSFHLILSLLPIYETMPLLIRCIEKKLRLKGPIRLTEIVCFYCLAYIYATGQNLVKNDYTAKEAKNAHKT